MNEKYDKNIIKEYDENNNLIYRKNIIKGLEVWYFYDENNNKLAVLYSACCPGKRTGQG